MAKQITTPDGPRWYELPDGVRLPSVTTILRAVAKPALIPWAAERERIAVVEHAANLYEDAPVKPRLSRTAFMSSLYSRLGKPAHELEARAAAASGSQAHRLIEWALRGGIGRPPEANAEAIYAAGAFEAWASGRDIKPLLIEQEVWSREWGFAGTMDLLTDGEVMDWKTGHAIYPEARLQVAAYAHALVEMGHAQWPLRGRIVCFPRDASSETIELVLSPEEMTEAFRVFLNVVELWKFLNPVPPMPETPVMAERTVAEPARLTFVF